MIQITDFSITPIQAKTGDQLSVNAQIDCTNYWYTCENITVSIKVNGQQVSSELVSVGAWSGFVSYTKKIIMPSSNAFIEISFQEENKISRQASIINTSPLLIPPTNGNGGIIDETDNNMLIGTVTFVLIGAAAYLLLKD